MSSSSLKAASWAWPPLLGVAPGRGPSPTLMPRHVPHFTHRILVFQMSRELHSVLTSVSCMSQNLNNSSQTTEQYLRILRTELFGKGGQVDASVPPLYEGPSFPATLYPQSPLQETILRGCLTGLLMVCLAKRMGLLSSWPETKKITGRRQQMKQISLRQRLFTGYILVSALWGSRAPED